jgi:hypothetical protein
MPADMVEMSRQVAGLLRQTGESSNLLAMLVSTSLLHVPSLLATVGPAIPGRVLEIDHPVAAFALFAGFSLIGLLIGVVYMNLLARKLPLGGGPKPATLAAFTQTVTRHWLMVLLYLLVLTVVLVAGSVPAILATALLTLLSPALASLFVVFLSGALLVLFFYLYFVTAALVLDNLPVHLAMAQSFGLVRSNFWATLGFILLSLVISSGMALIMSRLTAWPPLGIVVAIAINAYIGSGLTMALLVFYRTRILKEKS